MTQSFADPPANVDVSTPEIEEVVAVARGMATAVAPETGITSVQAALLGAVTKAVTGYTIAAANSNGYGGGMLMAPDASTATRTPSRCPARGCR